MKRLLSIDETAQYLGIKRSTLYKWAWLRQIPSVKMGSRLLFDRDDLDRFINDHKNPTSTASD